MIFYNMNKGIGLAKNIDVSDGRSTLRGPINMFTISDNFESIYSNFLFPNICRKLGSYVIYDYNDMLYYLFKNSTENADYQIERYTVNDTFNAFHTASGEDDIRALADTIVRNSPYFQKYLNEGQNSVYDIFYLCANLVISLILIYLIDKAPVEKRNFAYINKILKKLNDADVEYFKKVFTKIDSSYKIQEELFSLKNLKDSQFKTIIQALAKALINTTDTRSQNSTIFEKIEELYTVRKTKIIFVEMSGQKIIDSFLCYYAEKHCYKADVTEKSVPIFYVYAPINQIGYIPNFSRLLDNLDKKNDVHILMFNQLPHAIKNFGPDIKAIFKALKYGVIFQTIDEKNIKYTQKLLANSNISTLMEQITANQAYCVVYNSDLKASVEQKLSKQEANFEEHSTDEVSNTSSADTTKNLIDSLDTKEELLGQLKKDIDEEPDSIKKQHFANLYNTFSE